MEEKKKSGFATASLVLSIIGICTSFIPIINNISAILGLIGIIFGIVALCKKSSKGVAIVGIIVSVLTIIAVINVQQSLSNSLNKVSAEIDKVTGNSTEEVLKNNADVTLGKFEVTTDKYGMKNTKLAVTVKNKTTEKKSFSIHIEAVDSTGNRLADDYVYANELNANQTQNFETFTLVTNDKINSLKDVTFKIVEVSMI